MNVPEQNSSTQFLLRRKDMREGIFSSTASATAVGIIRWPFSWGTQVGGPLLIKRKGSEKGTRGTNASRMMLGERRA